MANYEPTLSSGPTEAIRIRLPKSVLKVIKTEAKKQNRFQTYVLREIVTAWAERVSRKKAK